ncbi:MAG: hypothetical protein KDC80_17815, partial [Saprospiraceae bacterium]|nr:hypothetical protein [Saprospiraceae bacterium]
RGGSNLEISFKAEGMNMRAGQSWSWTEKNYFQIDGNNIELIKVDKSTVQMKATKIGEGG